MLADVIIHIIISKYATLITCRTKYCKLIWLQT